MRNEKLESVVYGLLFGVMIYLLLYIGFKNDNSNNNSLTVSYEHCCTVTQVYSNTVVVTDCVGNDWIFDTKQDYNLGDVLIVPYNNNNTTDNIYDDIILVNKIKVVE